MSVVAARAFALSWCGSFALASLLGACGSDAPPTPMCADTVFGDPTQPMQIVVGEAKYVFTPDSNPMAPKVVSSAFKPLMDGDVVDVRVPPQGGAVSWVGARITNVAQSCGVTLRGSFFDLETGNQVEYEQRPVNFIAAADAPGWAEPDVARLISWPNVPLCPDYLAKDIVGSVFRLEVKVTTPDGTTATASVKVTPACADENPKISPLCACACKANYTLAKCQNGGM